MTTALRLPPGARPPRDAHDWSVVVVPLTPGIEPPEPPRFGRRGRPPPGETMPDFAPTSALVRWRSLAGTFPVIRDYAPVEALTDPAALDAWASDVGSSGARHAAAFLCNVWNSRHPWKVGTFDLLRALDVWDSGQVGAFRAWVDAGCRRF